MGVPGARSGRAEVVSPTRCSRIDANVATDRILRRAVNR
jgi:hypothetical protein